MDLERLSVRLRPRVGWESVDLGVALARHWWRPIYASWSILAAPTAILLVSLLGGLGLLLFWWLLPLAESVVLFTLSRAVFGSVPSWKETLRAVPRLCWRSIGELGPRRLQPARLLYLPLSQLEGLRGKQRRRRAAALAVGQEVSGLLTTVFLVFEIGLGLAVIGLAVVMTPGWTGVDWELIGQRFFDGTLPRGGYLACELLMAATVLALHPLYVGAGFALYLNRRTELEGWDLEIAFRRLARRVRSFSRKGAGVSAAVPVILGLVSLLAVAGSGAAPASEVEVPEASGAVDEIGPGVWQGDPERDPRRVIGEVVARPELRRRETVVRWRFRDDLLGERDAGSSSSPSRVLVAIARIVAVIFEPLLWLAAAVVVAFLLRAAWRRLPAAPEGGDRSAARPPERLFGLDLRPETLPADVPGEAEALWRAGRHAAALSLLYRGALGRLAADGLELRESFTEDDCLRAARPRLTARRHGFLTELTRAWQLVAYAHRVPDGSLARRLWSGWAECFGAAA